MNTILTERLRLVPLSQVDAPFILELLNSDGWLTYIGERNVHTIRDAQHYIQKILANVNMRFWVACLKENGNAAGLITLIKRSYLENSDLGFAFLPEYVGKGFGYESSKAVLNFCAEENEIKFDAITLQNNFSSISLLEKLGFRYQRVLEIDETKLLLYNLACANS